VLMNAVVGAHLFTGYGVGNGDEVRLTHLQFADDTLIIGEKSWLNVRTMRLVLLLFEELSGLKVNFHKSMLTGVNISASWLSKTAVLMNCRRGIIPFFLFGVAYWRGFSETFFLETCDRSHCLPSVVVEP